MCAGRSSSLPHDIHLPVHNTSTHIQALGKRQCVWVGFNARAKRQTGSCPRWIRHVQCWIAAWARSSSRLVRLPLATRRLSCVRPPIRCSLQNGGCALEILCVGCLSLPSRIKGYLVGPRGGVVTQRSAKPFTSVQFWSWPPFICFSNYLIKVFHPFEQTADRMAVHRTAPCFE
jgi:hypothetical protein